MTKEMTKILADVLKSVTYNEQTKTYQLSQETVKKLNLYTRKIKIITKACEELGIILVYPNKPLPDIKGEELFSEYNDIKSKLEIITDPEEKNILEARRITIRNVIAQYNMELIETIINRKLNASGIETLDNNIDIEDLYQIGYEILLEYIDNNYLEISKFKYDIRSLLILRIKQILYSQRGISEKTAKEIIALRTSLEMLPSNTSILDLSVKLNIEESRVKTLLNLNGIISYVALSEADSIFKELSESQDSLEEMMIKKLQEEQLLRIIETLPTETQKKVIMLLCGFNGESVHTYKEVANELGDTKGTICSIRKATLQQLSSPLRTKYLKQIMNMDISENEKNNLSSISLSEQIIFKKMELFLLQQLDQNILETLIKNLKPKFKEALLMYLGYIEKSDRYIKNSTQSKIDRESALEFVRNKITELYVIDNPNEEITNYFDFLMYNYLNRPKPKIKRK